MKNANVHEHRGFALVVTLSLMILLTIVAVGLLNLATITLRTSGQGELQARARANARLALMMAIGDLQKYAGPDTRVTANASQQNSASPNPSWLGVWKTRPDEDLTADQPGSFPIGIQGRDVFLTDQRAPKAAANRWLVSSPDVNGASPDATPDNSFVTLLETGKPESTVKVPKLPLDDNSACAWWVSDESQKALINLPDFQKGSTDRQQFSLIAAQDFDLETYDITPPAGKPLAGHDKLASEQLESVVSLDTGSLLPVANPTAFHKSIAESSLHLTTDSLGLFTNVKDSGLKRDLTAFIARGVIGQDPKTKLPGLKESDPILPGQHHSTTGPRFGSLKGWADLADQLDKESGPAAMAPQPPSTRFQTFTNSAPGPLRDLTNVLKPAIQPVVVEASLGWDFSPYRKGTSATEYLRGHIYPRLTLWNPFNVTLKATRFVVMLRHPLYGSFTARGVDVDSRSARLYFDDVCGKPTSAFLGFVTEPTEFSPGETKIFTPAIGASSGTKLFGRSAALNPLSYDSNVLTAEQIPGVENFHFDSNVILPGETAANRDLPYGFSSNMNSFYSNTRGFDDEFIVAQVNGGSGTIDWNSVTANSTTFPRIAHFICQNWGLNRYDKWYGAEKSNHASNNGTPFREFKPGASGIGALDNRRPPRLWRRGVRMAWFDDEAEYNANQQSPVRARYTQPWFSSSNIRGGLVYHRNWVNLPFSPGWDRPAFDSHTYFLQPTDPQLLATFYPPSPFANPDDGFPTTCTIYDVPRRKTGIISLGQFQHAQLSYCSWHPSFVIGNGERTMNADLDATAIKDKVKEPNRWKDNPGNAAKVLDYDSIIQKGAVDQVLVYDLAYETNEALWDRFMLSSIPYQGAPGSRRPNWDLETPLPVGRYALSPLSSRMTPENVKSRLSSEPSFPYFRSAEFLANRGAFNVNSSSVQAWTALLGSMRGLQRESLEGGASTGDHPLCRSAFSGEPGTPSISSPSATEAWNAFRSLTDTDIANLAENIVEEIRKRGPFLSVADFVNRRLTTDVGPSASGTLDQAIANSRINSGLETPDAMTELSDVGPVSTAANRSRTISYGMPGYLTQGDLLTALAPVITARGDTFRVRAYGEASSKDGRISRAWCEALVQRNVDYVDPADDPLMPAIDISGSTPKVGSISKTSLSFGRRFTMLSFRWLPVAEMQNNS